MFIEFTVTDAAGNVNNFVYSDTVPCANTLTGMVAWYRAEGNTQDSAGAVNNAGTFVGTPDYDPGQVGQAFELVPHNYVQVPASPELNVGTGPGFTIQSWINPDNVAGNQPIVEYNSGSAIGVHLWQHPAQDILYANVVDTNGADHTIASPAGALTPGIYQHVAVTYDPAGTGTLRLFVNGNQVAVNTTAGTFTPQTSYDLYIGHRPFGNPQTYSGEIDEVQIFNRALAQTEIAAIVASGSTGVCPGTDLSITKTDSPDPVVAGGFLTYTLNVVNNGTATAQNVVITDPIPAGTTGGFALFYPAGTNCGYNAGVTVVTCTIPSMAAGTSQEISLVVQVNPNVPNGTVISNTATVASDTPETNAANDSSTTTTTVNAQADLTLTKTDSPDPVVAGQNLTYTVTLNNNGPSDAQNVALADPFRRGPLSSPLHHRLFLD